MSRVVVVGAGASGAALAARISEDPDCTVTLVEAGPFPHPFPPELLDGSSVRAAMPGSPYTWSYPAHLTPERPYRIARGRIAGGSSTINGGYVIRPRQGDLERWERVGGQAWSAARMLPVLAEMETDLDFGDRAGHGDSGPVPIRRPSQASPIARAFTAAARAAGAPWEEDKNAPGPIGVGPVPLDIIDGVRVNTALAYLVPALGRRSLRVMADTVVHRILIEGGRAIGVATDRGDVRGDEVVLCAGAIATPHLLLLSGVGPRAALEQHGVRVVADLPVGAGFSDHPSVTVGWRSRTEVMDPHERVAFPTVLHVDSSGAAGRHPDGDIEILASVKTRGHLLGDERRVLPDTDAFPLTVGLQSPVGRGEIGLVSADPITAPRIDYGYLREDEDRARLRHGVRLAVGLLRAEPFSDIVGDLSGIGDAELDDDAALDAWIRAHIGTAIHLCGSAPLGSVVDHAGRVLGVDGLRVADTSLLPVVPSRGPFASAVLVGEVVGRALRDGA